MKEMDNVRVIVEKEEYAKDGVHKGMYGWICDERFIDGSWLVNFPQCGAHADIATLSMLETDLELTPILYAEINEKLKAQFGD